MRFSKLQIRWLSIIGAVLLASILGLVLRDRWLPVAKQWITPIQEPADDPSEDDQSESGHGHPHAGHDETTTLELSKTAGQNIGLQTAKVELQPFERTIAVPAMVVERPGRSRVEVTAPLTGVVTRIFPIEAEAIQPGQLLYELRLTHEDLVTAQRDFLRSVLELDVVTTEVQRLSTLTDVIEGKRLLEKKYQQKIAEGTLHAQRQGLLLHGLSEQQIQQIIKTRKLLQAMTVVAPPFAKDEQHQEFEHVYHVQKINVTRGQHVSAGETLAVLADHCELYLEGNAFEQDAERLTQAAKEGWTVKAVPAAGSPSNGQAQQLKVLYLADRVEPNSRAFHFYMRLPNKIASDTTSDGHRFISWKYRPGQRMQVLIPIERWEDQVVLPVDGVVQEGAETYVFKQIGNQFHRVAVHVQYRDKDWVVIEDDGLLVGRMVVVAGAYQMQLALKNKAGGGIDPHAGHSH